VSALKHNYSAILLVLEEIVYGTKQPDVRAKEVYSLNSKLFNLF